MEPLPRAPASANKKPAAGSPGRVFWDGGFRRRGVMVASLPQPELRDFTLGRPEPKTILTGMSKEETAPAHPPLLPVIAPLVNVLFIIRC